MALPEDGDHQDMGGACPSGTTLGPSATTPDVSPLRIGARTTQSHPPRLGTNLGLRAGQVRRL